VEPSDALTCSVAAVLVVVCLLPGYVPARRIASLNPVDVLRAE
jgi:ABC-type lipoprotein release transport system permease subunit